YGEKKPGVARLFISRDNQRYTAWMLEACFPLGPVVTSNETFWPSFSDLNPGMLIAEKCANKSSPPPSDVMKPKPLASLNHFTVPVAMFSNSLKQKIIGSNPADVSISRTGKYGVSATAKQPDRSCFST